MIALGIDVGGSSVKLAALENDHVLWIAQSAGYEKPTREQLTAAIRSTLKSPMPPDARVGICVPGQRDRARRTVTHSVNIPSLNGLVLDELVAEALNQKIAHLEIASDAVANGYDLFATNRLTGRLLSLALGTGVGAAVIDDGVPLMVDGESPGHIGQVDCSIEGDPVIGPDGGAGSLEGYIGVPALAKRYDADIPTILARLGPEDSALKALARAIRICHGIYCPHHVALTGGLGIRMQHLLPTIRQLVEKDLTRIARAGWTLLTGKDDYHAARGIARMAQAAANC
ncbi:MAG TPA: ROK family protein [Tepidisphaeraceae bacterium]|jgi:predicted NBD/HSP70 family sugar kinase